MKKEGLMQRGEWLLVQIVATVILLGGALFLTARLRENADILRGHGAVEIARGMQSGDAAQVIVGREVQRHDYGGLIVWGVTLVLVGLVWLVPLFVAAVRQPPPRS